MLNRRSMKLHLKCIDSGREKNTEGVTRAHSSRTRVRSVTIARSPVHRIAQYSEYLQFICHFGSKTRLQTVYTELL